MRKLWLKIVVVALFTVYITAFSYGACGKKSGGDSSGSSGGGGGGTPPPANPWTQKIADDAGGSPVKREGHSMVWDGTMVIMFGGFDSFIYYKDLWWYNPAINAWADSGATNSPPERYLTSMVWDGTKVIMFGGAYATWPYRKNDLWWYNRGTNTWLEKTPTAVSPTARAGHQMVWDSTNVIMYGGVGSGAVNKNDLWWYNPGTNTWLEKTPTAVSPTLRSGFSMVWDGTKVILFGGKEVGSGTYKNDVWYYYPGTNTWSPAAAFGAPPGRTEHSMVWDGTNVIMFGGRSSEGSYGKYNDLWSYNPGTNTWTEKTAQGASGSPIVRKCHSMAWDEIRVIMFGGEGADAGSGYYHNDLWWYTP